MSPELLDQVDDFVGVVALGASVVEKVFGVVDEGALFRGAGDRDAAAAAEFEQAFVAELAEGAEDGVGVDAEGGGGGFGGGGAVAGVWVGGLTRRTAARSLAGGSRSPGLASPSAMARRISAATCACRSRGLSW